MGVLGIAFSGSIMFYVRSSEEDFRDGVGSDFFLMKNLKIKLVCKNKGNFTLKNPNHKSNKMFALGLFELSVTFLL